MTTLLTEIIVTFDLLFTNSYEQYLTTWQTWNKHSNGSVSKKIAISNTVTYMVICHCTHVASSLGHHKHVGPFLSKYVRLLEGFLNEHVYRIHSDYGFGGRLESPCFWSHMNRAFIL